MRERRNSGCDSSPSCCCIDRENRRASEGAPGTPKLRETGGPGFQNIFLAYCSVVCFTINNESRAARPPTRPPPRPAPRGPRDPPRLPAPAHHPPSHWLPQMRPRRRSSRRRPRGRLSWRIHSPDQPPHRESRSGAALARKLSQTQDRAGEDLRTQPAAGARREDGGKVAEAE